MLSLAGGFDVVGLKATSGRKGARLEDLFSSVATAGREDSAIPRREAATTYSVA